MDITFGVIPMVILTFKGYRQGRNLRMGYKSFNDDLRRVLTDIATTTAIFKHTVDELLEVAGGTPELTYEYLEDGNWDKDDLNDKLKDMLGDCFDILRGSMCSTHETIQEIGDFLLLMNGTITTQPAKKNKTLFFRQPKTTTAITPPTVEVNPLQPEFRSMQMHSARRKLFSVAEDHLGNLKRLLNDLKAHKDDFRAIFKHAKRRLSGLPGGKTAVVDRPPSPGKTGNLNCDMTQACLRLRTVQTASQNLYRMISQALQCDCHSTHLRLDRQVNKTPTAKDPKGKSKQPLQAESEPHFSFQLTFKSNNSGKKRVSTITQPLRLVCISHSFQDTDSGSNDNKIERRICEELSCSTKEYERRLRDSAGIGNSGFLLRRAGFSAKATNTSNSVKALSLHSLVGSHDVDLYQLDRFLITINLAYSLVHFYSSPWVRDWSLESIHYFEKQEPSSAIGNWTPHLSLVFDSADFNRIGDENKEIYLLGHILLQLGGNKKLCIPQGEGKELALGKALDGLTREMGRGYVDFVRNCLTLWSDRSMDLMKDDNLNTFLSQVSLLEDRVAKCWP